MSYRILEINELIKQQMAEMITREIDLKPGVFLTISKVDTSRDLRYTHIFVSIFPEKETNYVMETLKKESFALQKELNKRLFLKIVPKVSFYPDTTESKADEVEKILDDIKKE